MNLDSTSFSIERNNNIPSISAMSQVTMFKDTRWYVYGSRY